MDEYGPIELSAIAEKNRQRIQSKITACIYCQPYDSGEPVWIWGDCTELSDLFCELNIPEKQWEAIASNLICPNCGNETLEVWSDVGVKSQYEIALDKYVRVNLKKHHPIVLEFEKLIEKTPMLAASHKMGRKILKEMKDENYPTVTVDGEFFRARKYKADSEMMTPQQMLNPETGIPNEGRYNHAGQSYLYLSDNDDTAIEEISEKKAWVQKFELSKPIDKILDLTFNWEDIALSYSPILLALCSQNTIGRSDRNVELWRPDYFITRYIMDCAKHLGYNGINYSSTKSSYVANVVLFYPEKCKLTPIGSPQVQETRNLADD